MTGVVADPLLLAVFASPPPETVAVLTTLAGALCSTLTVSVKGGALCPAGIAVVRVQVTVRVATSKLHVQPVPVAAL